MSASSGPLAQQSVIRLRQALTGLVGFFNAAHEADPLPTLHKLVGELLSASEVHIAVPAAASPTPDQCLSTLSYPVFLGGRPMGRLDAWRATPFDDDDHALAASMGRIIGIVLEQSAAYSQFVQHREQAQANADTLDQLLIFGRHIVSGALDQRRLAVQIATQVLDMVGGDRASLLLTPFDQPDAPMLILNNGSVATTERAAQVRDQGMAGLVLRERQPLIVDETDTDRRWLTLGFREYDSPTRCAMAVPLIWGQRTLGALTVTTTQSRLFNTPQLNLLELIACHVSLALYSATIHTHLTNATTLLSDTAHGLNDELQAAQLGLQLLTPTDKAGAKYVIEADELAKIEAALGRASEAGRRIHAAQRMLQELNENFASDDQS